MNICVYAASSNMLAPAFYEEAEKLGRLLAEGGHTLVFGGGAEGLMGACARGARQAGGRLIGVAPRFFDEPGILLKQDIDLVFTDTMSERKAEMARLSDAFIALPGGIGTYEEFFETLTLRQLGRHHKPMALLSTLDYYAPFEALLQHTAREGFMSGAVLSLFAVCRTPGEALAHVTAPVEEPDAAPSLAAYSR